MTKSKLISSGSYGCVFYPKIPCDKEKHKTKNKLTCQLTSEINMFLYIIVLRLTQQRLPLYFD